MTEKMTFEQFCEQYDNEEKCMQALFNARWPDGFRCPHCSHQQFYLILTRRIPLFECISCHSQTSLIAGTILEKSRTPLRSWFQALFLHSQSDGISAKHLASIISTTYKTAWLICHKIRHAMSRADSQELLTGLVRINWGSYGNPYNPTIFRHHQEHPLLVGASITNDGEFNQIKIKQVQDQNLQHNHVAASAGYDFKQQHVDPYASEVVVINQKFSPHRSRPLIKVCLRAARWINNIFKGIGSKHLQSYLDQFCYGYNTNKKPIDAFASLLQNCATNPSITYRQLIMRENKSPQHKQHYFAQLKRIS